VLDVFRQTRSKRSTFNFQRSMKAKDERVKGIEPSCVAWEATVLPLNYTRVMVFNFRLFIFDLQAANNHCHEVTSSLDEADFLSPEPPAPSLPNDQAITLHRNLGALPAFVEYGLST
jgi:hypothetical protein